MLPWIAAHRGVTHAEIAARFDLSVEDVVDDLNTVFMVGVPPYTPDTMIDVITEGDHVTVYLGDAFTRPLRLSDRELLSLYLAVRAMAGAGTSDGYDVLRSAATKLAAALGLDGAATLSVDLGDADREVLGSCRDALERGRQLDLDYYSFADDRTTRRRVDPEAVFARDGHWYLWGWCHLAGASRMFRVDRIRSAAITGEPVAHRAVGAPPEPRPQPGSGPTVVLAVAPAAVPSLEEFRPLSVEALPDGRAIVELTVSGDAWLSRLVLRLGPDATVLDRPENPRALRRDEVLAKVLPVARAIRDRHTRADRPI